MKPRTLRVVTKKRVGLLARVLQLSVIFVSVVFAMNASATTLVVGNCKSSGYPTIQQAINAAPVGATVQVCPGSYLEQVVISRSVTLQGITANNGDNVYIDAPLGGLVVNATDLFGDPVVAQVLVTEAGGPVNISNLSVLGEDFTTQGVLFAGIYYQNSPGTINGVIVESQSGNQLAIGIFLEGGASSPSVTVQNSWLSDIDYAAIDFETIGRPSTALTAKITNNFVFLDNSNKPAGIQFGSGTTATVTGNSVLGSGGGDTGILIAPGATGSVSGNSVTSTSNGIQTNADGILVTSNKLSKNGVGIDLGTSIGGVKSNIIIDAGLNGIEFRCNKNPNVLSNVINGAYGTGAVTGVGLSDVPLALNTSTNKVFNAQIVRTGGCS